MGCPIETYKEMLINYIQSNVRCTKHEKAYNESFLYEKGINDIEMIAKTFNQENHALACFYAGSAAAQFFIDNDDCCDTINAGAGGLVMLKKFFDIKDNKI